MACSSQLLLALAIFSMPAAAVSDVPLGECHDCEVTCFEDCTLKFDREIIQMDMFLQTASSKQKNRTEQLTEQYTECVTGNCPCKKAAAGKSTSKPQTMLVAEDKKKKAQCSVGGMGCASKCGQKVIQQLNSTKKSFLQKKDFPLHAVKINTFAKGAMNLDQCLKYCLSATCGCADAPVNIEKEMKANAAAGEPVKDTPKSPQYRPAKIEECAKGMIGKKVASDLYIKIEGGPGGMFEICSKDFLTKLLGPSGDVSGMTKKCKSGASDDAKFGCLWDDQKGKCTVGFSPILTCQVQYFDDPTL